MGSSLHETFSLPSVPKDVIEHIIAADGLHLLTHLRGDADSATIFALASALSKLGKSVFCAHDIPEHLAWLVSEAWTSPLTGNPLIVAVDTGNFSRLVVPAEAREGIRATLRKVEREDEVSNTTWAGIYPVDIVIDHHVSNPGYGRLNWVAAGSSSSAELLIALILALEEETGTTLLDQEMAWRLFTGLASDTQWFQRPIGASAYAAAAVLESRFEVDKVAIAESLRAQSEGYFRLGGSLRESFRMEQGVASAFLGRDAMDAYGVTAEEAAALIEDLERLPVRISLLFIESKTNEIRVRLRGKDVPIIQLAKEYGGGGHTYRAGAVVANREEADSLFQRAIEYAATSC